MSLWLGRGCHRYQTLWSRHSHSSKVCVICGAHSKTQRSPRHMARDSAMGSRDEKHLYSFRVDPRCLIIFRNSYDKLKHAQAWVCDIFSFKMFMNIKEISIWFRKFLTVLHFKLTLMGTIEFLFYFIKWLKALGFSLQASLWACILFVSMYLGHFDLNPKGQNMLRNFETS